MWNTEKRLWLGRMGAGRSVGREPIPAWPDKMVGTELEKSGQVCICLEKPARLDNGV